MSTKPNKPTPKELLKELEAIHASLLPDDGATAEKNLQRNKGQTAQTPKAKTQIPTTPASKEVPLREHDNVSQAIPSEADCESTRQESTGSMTVLPGQQSLFEEANSASNSQPNYSVEVETQQQSSEIKTQDSNLENPFLPKHVKERLDRERSLYQKEIDAAAKLQNPNAPLSDIEDHDSLIDELVKLYLPQIEHELRLRLKKSLEKAEKRE